MTSPNFFSRLATVFEWHGGKGTEKCYRRIFFFLLVLWLGFLAVGGILYPVSGDDFVFLGEKPVSLLAFWKQEYFRLSMRTGNFAAHLFAYSGKWLFDLLNPLVQGALLLGGFRLAFGRWPDRRCATDYLLLALLILLLWVGVARPRDTIFWTTGSIVYSWALALVLFFFGCCRNMLQENASSPRFPWLAAGGMLVIGILAGGCNESNSLIGSMLFGSVFSLAWLRKHRLPFLFWFAGAGFLAGVVFLLTEPGLHARAASGALPFWAIGAKLRLLPQAMAFYLYSSWISWVLVAFFAAARWRNGKFKGDPALRDCAILLAVSLGTALVFAAAGTLPAVRAYYSGSVLAALAAVRLADSQLRANGPRVVLTAMSLLAVYAAVILIPASGDFLKIHRDEAVRQELLTEFRRVGERHPVVPPHRVGRRSLLQYIWVEDITDDPEFWLNTLAAKYYGFETIRTSETNAAPRFWQGR